MTIPSPLPLAVVALALTAMPAASQHGDHGPEHDTHHPSLFTDLGEDVAVVKNKLMGLAEAIPEGAYDWRPAEGVRSIRETLLHVAADNYFIPIALGQAPPASTGISESYESTKVFEAQDLQKAEVAKALEQSFVYLQALIDDGDPTTMGEAVNLFGQESTVQRTWVLTVTHLHEHLGQMIAYARTNGVAPPWSM